MPSDDDTATVTCAWFAKDALRQGSFPAKALKKYEPDVRTMSTQELQRIAAEGGCSRTGDSTTTALAVGDTVLLQSAGPIMTIVSIEPSVPA